MTIQGGFRICASELSVTDDGTPAYIVFDADL